MLDPSTVYLDHGVELAPDVVDRAQRHPARRDVDRGADAGSARARRSSTRRSARTAWSGRASSSARRRGRRHDRAVQPPAAGLARGPRAEIGNFAELKNSRLGEHVRQHHISYLGDADLGADTNVGAGTITANYDGVAQAPHDDRRGRVPRRRHDAPRAGDARRRRRRPAPARSSRGTSRRASSPSASRPGSASRTRQDRRRTMDAG